MHNLSLFFIVLLISCSGRNIVFEEYKAIPNQSWEIENKVGIKANIDNPLSFYNLYFNVRNTNGYPYNNLYVFLDIVAPDGNTQTDTIECILADRSGKWQGNSSGSIWDNHILFKRNIHFPKEGTYTFNVQHGMREQSIGGITDVGLAIEQVKAN